MEDLKLDNASFLAGIDTGKVDTLMKDMDENVKYFNTVSTYTADKYTTHLDELMKKLYTIIKKPDVISLDELENYYLELTNLIYFMGGKLEQLSIYDDMSKSAQKEAYNNAYLANQAKDTDKKTKATVAENTAVAEKESQYEMVVNSIYSHAYKIVKFRVESAQDMVSTLRKVISRRMTEMQLSSFGTNKTIINDSEDFE